MKNLFLLVLLCLSLSSYAAKPKHQYVRISTDKGECIIILTITNALSFALYLGICRPIISRYSVITLMKWMFLFSFIVSLPFSANGIVALDYGAVPAKVWWEVAYLIVFATFVAYFLIPVGQQRIRPTLVSMYGYLQPLIAAIVGVAVGMDRLTATKVLAAVCVFAGVAIVNRSRAAG